MSQNAPAVADPADPAPDPESAPTPAPEPAEPAEPAEATDTSDAGPVEPPADPAPTGDDEPEHRPRRGRLPRTAAVAVVLLVVALALAVFAVVAPRANADQVFVETARSEGHHVTIGDQQSLLVSAARKICQRREFHATVAQRRATALSPTELHAVQQTFVGDTRGFTVLALHTYCPD